MLFASVYEVHPKVSLKLCCSVWTSDIFFWGGGFPFLYSRDSSHRRWKNFPLNQNNRLTFLHWLFWRFADPLLNGEESASCVWSTKHKEKIWGSLWEKMLFPSGCLAKAQRKNNLKVICWLLVLESQFCKFHDSGCLSTTSVVSWNFENDFCHPHHGYLWHGPRILLLRRTGARSSEIPINSGFLWCLVTKHSERLTSSQTTLVLSCQSWIVKPSGWTGWHRCWLGWKTFTINAHVWWIGAQTNRHDKEPVCKF